MTAEAQIAVGSVDAEAVLLVDAMAAAYVTDQLYPSAAEQPIFRRAVETLGTATHLPIRLHVGPGVFIWRDKEVATAREGAERLAKRLFVHDVGAVEIVASPEPQDLMAAFDIINCELEEVELEGGPYLALMAKGVEAIRLLPRAMIEGDEGSGSSEEEDEDRDDRVTSLLERGKEPEAIAAHLQDQTDDVEETALKFVEWYLDVYSRLEKDDFAGREEVVKAFVESFFYFQRSTQVRIFREFLDRKEHDPCQVFLDQFAGHELAALAPELDPSANDKLNEYTRISTDSADARPEELLALLQSASEVKEARNEVARRVQSLIDRDDIGEQRQAEWYVSLRSRVPTEQMHRDAATRVLRALAEVEERDHRFHRLLRVWSGRAAMSIRAGEVEAAVRWIEAITQDPVYPPDRAEAVQNALFSMATADVLEHVVVAIQNPDQEEWALRLLEIWGHSITGRLMERLAEDENPASRRVLIDLLGSIARIDPQSLFQFLTDPRWYVIRNLAVILGKSGRAEAAPRVRPLVAHGDHRVRVEALRSLASLAPGDGFVALVQALGDSHPRVKSTALTLLRKSENSRANEVLMEALSKSRTVEDVRQISDVLAARGDPDARSALQRSARRRFALTVIQRAKRDAARAALRKVQR